MRLKCAAVVMCMAAATALLVLSACEPIFLGSAGYAALKMNPEDVNLKQTSYIAADQLVQQAQVNMSRYDVLTVGTLSNVNDPGERVPMARLIPQQVGTRMVQLGYRVSESQTPMALGRQPLGTQLPGQQSSKNVMITGTYSKTNKELMVSLRLIDTNGNFVVGAYDYVLPMVRDIRELSLTQEEKEKDLNILRELSL